MCGGGPQHPLLGNFHRAVKSIITDTTRPKERRPEDLNFLRRIETHNKKLKPEVRVMYRYQKVLGCTKGLLFADLLYQFTFR